MKNAPNACAGSMAREGGPKLGEAKRAAAIQAAGQAHRAIGIRPAELRELKPGRSRPRSESCGPPGGVRCFFAVLAAIACSRDSSTQPALRPTRTAREQPSAEGSARLPTYAAGPQGDRERRDWPRGDSQLSLQPSLARHGAHPDSRELFSRNS
jgi:hypothetical protein